MKPKTKGVVLVDSQPPHMGEFLQVLSQLSKYDYLYICVNARSSVISLKHVFEIWTVVLQPYVGKVHIVALALDFVSIAKNELPQMFEDCMYLTADRKIFVHLSSMNVPTELIASALGYNDAFIKVAFRQSKALDWLENKFVTPQIT